MTDTSEIQPTYADLISKVAQGEIEKRHGNIPAEVVSYDAEAQTCDAEPLILIVVDGVPETLPPLREVPVRWPSGNGWSIVGTLKKGDVVWLKPSGGDISGWKTGSKRTTPTHLKRNSLSDVIADPGARPLGSALGSDHFHADGPVFFADSVLFLGDSTAKEFVALGKSVWDELVKIDSHTHGPGTFSNSGGNVAGLSGEASYSAPADETAIQSEKVKAK